LRDPLSVTIASNQPDHPKARASSAAYRRQFVHPGSMLPVGQGNVDIVPSIDLRSTTRASMCTGATWFQGKVVNGVPTARCRSAARTKT
jgi:hypothetical protein